MPTVLPSISDYPTIQTITDLVRSDIRDDMAGATNTLGEGQILVNDLSISVTMANLFNSAVRELCRELRLQQAPMLITDNYIIRGIPPMNGPMGFQVADPAVQVAIGQNGYFDGTEWHASLCLPQGVFQVVRCWERPGSGSGLSSMVCTTTPAPGRGGQGYPAAQEFGLPLPFADPYAGSGPSPIRIIAPIAAGQQFTNWAVSSTPGNPAFLTFYDGNFTVLQSIDIGAADGSTVITVPDGTVWFILGSITGTTADPTGYSCAFSLAGGDCAYEWNYNSDDQSFGSSFASTTLNFYPLGQIEPGWTVFTETITEPVDGIFLIFYDASFNVIQTFSMAGDPPPPPPISVPGGPTYSAPAGAVFWSAQLISSTAGEYDVNYTLTEMVTTCVSTGAGPGSSTFEFSDMGEPSNGMAGVNQTQGWGRWEWRNQMVWTPGSLDYRDLRIRYLMLLQKQFVANANPATTYVPIIDCEEAIARKIDRLYSARQGGAIYDIRKAESDAATNAFLNEQVKRKQGTNYQTLIYGDEGPPVLNWGQ